MKTAAIIQARMGSTRLSGKVMIPILGKPILQHLIERVKRSNVDEIIVATCEPSEQITELCQQLDVCCYIGDKENVFQRVLDAAEMHKVDVIVDITGDCPFVDTEHINFMLNKILNNKLINYISNCFEKAWPDGFDIQIYYTHIMSNLKNSKYKMIKFHTGWNVYNYLLALIAFVSYFEAPERYRHRYWGLTLDHYEDYVMIRTIFEHFNHNKFTAEEVMEYLFRHPEVLAINSHIKRKEPGEG